MSVQPKREKILSPLSLDREPGQPFPDASVEEYAQRRAHGSPVRAASLHVGLTPHAAGRLEKAPEFERRLQELRASRTEALDLNWIVSELMLNVRDARIVNAFKASNEAIIQLYEIYEKNKDLFDAGALQQVGAPEAAARRESIRGRLAVLAVVPSAAPSGVDNGQQRKAPGDGRGPGSL